jgi:hypothetical protein
MEARKIERVRRMKKDRRNWTADRECSKQKIKRGKTQWKRNSWFYFLEYEWITIFNP